MIAKNKNIFIYFLVIQLLLIVPSFSYAIDCASNNNWKRPSSQTMETKHISAALIKYENNERYFSMKRGESQVVIYYLEEMLLVKGLDDAEINFNEIVLLPAILATPVKIISQAFPQGPCKITKKTTFVLPDAEGEIVPSSDGGLNYKFVLIDKKSKEVRTINFIGTMRFTPPIPEPDKNTDVRGFKLVGRTEPYTVIGSSVLPVVTLKELRRVLKEKKSSSKP
jgi:hypothetical protein